MATTTDSSGFIPETKTFRSLRPALPLPSPATNFFSFLLSSLPCPLPSNPAFIVATATTTTTTSISYTSLLSQVHSLTASLHSLYPTLISTASVAAVISPPHVNLPPIFLSLLSLNITLSPINPSSTPSEITRLFSLTNPSIIFTTSSTLPNLPNSHSTPLLLLDSPHFSSLLNSSHYCTIATQRVPSLSATSDHVAAAIMFSSGTTGLVKAAALSHARFIAMVLGFRAMRPLRAGHEVTMLISPVFHSMGFANLLKGLVLGETTVVMERFRFVEMLAAMERFGVKALTTAPPVVAAMGREEEVVIGRFDLGRLRTVACGGAPLSVSAAIRFRRRFPRVQLRQVSVDKT